MRSLGSARLDELLGSVPGPVVRALQRIDRLTGTEALFAEQMPGLLTELATVARILSVKASSAIEGVVVEDARANRIVKGEVSVLRTRDEKELAGYRDALDHVLNHAPVVDLGLLLEFHRLLFAHTELEGGRFKSEDNSVVDVLADGSRRERFRPVPARETPYVMSEALARYGEAADGDRHHPLLLAGLLVLDVTIVHPFEDGNGRVSRLLTTHLLKRAGYGVGRYVSLEKIVHDRAVDYYDSLGASTSGWYADDHDPWPWLGFLVSVVEAGYQVFQDRAADQTSSVSKQARVREHVLRHSPSEFAVSDVRTALPGVSAPTIKIVLAQLRDEGLVELIGRGRGAAYRRCEMR